MRISFEFDCCCCCFYCCSASLLPDFDGKQSTKSQNIQLHSGFFLGSLALFVMSLLAFLLCLRVVVICCCCCRRPHSKFKNLYLLLLFLVKKLLSLNVSRCDYLGIENRHKSSLRHFDKENQLIHCNRNGISASLIYRAKA